MFFDWGSRCVPRGLEREKVTHGSFEESVKTKSCEEKKVPTAWDLGTVKQSWEKTQSERMVGDKKKLRVGLAKGSTLRNGWGEKNRFKEKNRIKSDIKDPGKQTRREKNKSYHRWTGLYSEEIQKKRGGGTHGTTERRGGVFKEKTKRSPKKIQEEEPWEIHDKEKRGERQKSKPQRLPKEEITRRKGAQGPQ